MGIRVWQALHYTCVILKIYLYVYECGFLSPSPSLNPTKESNLGSYTSPWIMTWL